MRIKSCTHRIITPTSCREGPPEVIVLSNNDQIMPRIYVRFLYFYTPAALANEGGDGDRVEDSEKTENFMSMTVLERSLRETLDLFYPVAGRLRERGNGGVDVECTGQGVYLFEVFVEGDFAEEIPDFAPREVYNLFDPCVTYNSKFGDLYANVVESPIFVAQVSRFQCGRVCLGVALHHNAGDGFAFQSLVKAWADLASSKDLKILPVLDRACLKAREHPKVKFPHCEYQIRAPPPSFSNMPPTTAKLFELSSEEVQSLRKIANKSDESSSYTRFEAVAGYVWQLVTRTREVDRSANIRFGIAVDGRTRFDPPLSQGYFGNVNFYGCATSNAGELISKPLSYAAARVHEVVVGTTDEYMRSALDFVELQNSPLDVSESFRSNLDFCISSWSRFQAYEVDFGWGIPDFFTIPAHAFDGLVIVLPPRLGGGGLNLVIGLRVDHMVALESEFFPLSVPN